MLMSLQQLCDRLYPIAVVSLTVARTA